MLNYLFHSERLGFRAWLKNDIEPLFNICADEQVMKYFPAVLNRDQTVTFIENMQSELEKCGYCYYAVDLLETGELIGFIGLKYQTYPSDFNPSTDIGWRLATRYWGKGLATEGAKRCLEYGFNELGLKKIVSVAPDINKPSINVMKKTGMSYVRNFKHSNLKGDERLESCVLYEINKKY